VIPAPNVLAGILIALAVSTGAKLLIGCIGWTFAACAYIWVKEGRAEKSAISYYRMHNDRLIVGSPVVTFYAIEWATTLATALVFSGVAFIVRKTFLS